MNLVQLFTKDGSWDRLRAQWTSQCQIFNEEFENYAAGTFGVLEPLASGDNPEAGVFALELDSEFSAISQINCTALPGYSGPVLRLRFLTLAPKFDFDTHSITEYSNLLMYIFSTVISLSSQEGPMNAKHLKFHLPSPSDRSFFAAVVTPLSKSDVFESVQMKGNWLYISKK